MMHLDWLSTAVIAGLQSDIPTVITLLLCLCAIAYYGVALLAAANFFEQPERSPSGFCPPVSILKPVCGLDRGIYENLASFCQQDYPRYQVIFGIQSAQDPCIEVVQQLMQDFPDIDMQLVISDQTIGINRKVSNLANAAVEAKYDILLLADSDIRVGPDYLQRVIQPFQTRSVGIVTCLYRSLTYTWLAALEALSLPTEFLPRILAAKRLQGMVFAIGATIAIRRSVLERIGGFSTLANYLEDDYQLGNRAVQAGYQIVLSNYVVDHVMTTENWQDFLHHQLRWFRGDRFARPLGYCSLIVTYGTVSSVLFLLTTGGSLISWVVLAVTWGMRLLLAWFVGAYHLRDPLARRFLWLVPLRDCISFAVWCCG